MRTGRQSDDLPVYAVRLTPAASAQAVAEHERLKGTLGAAYAEAWRQGLRASIASLATLPLRGQVAPEDTLYQQAQPGPPLRVLPYQPGRRRRGAVWRILFAACEATSDDPPTVIIELILYSTQTPLMEWPTDDENA